MKKGSFTGLLYREYYLGKISYKTALLFYLGSVLLGWLMLLSVKYGNFGLLFGKDLKGGIIKNKEASEILGLTIILTMKFLTLMSAALMCTVSADTAGKDIMTKWNRFEHCTPITPMRFAAVKTVSSAIQTTLGAILSVVYLFTMDLALGEKLTYGDISLIAVTIAVMSMISILAQIFVTLLKSVDKGWLCTTFLLMASFIIFSVRSNKNTNVTDKTMDISEIFSEVTKVTRKYCPMMLIMLGVSFGLLFVSMYLLYKRREK